ncbi:MAG TPA: hydrogenase expression/formation protein HypE [Phycisphaerae bacterium]|nr:hydrogenase expression/formation protein HypE [Phycisphaerae bacterium]
MKPVTTGNGTKNVSDKTRRVMLAHGGGGQLTDELIHQHVLPRLGNDVLNELLDSALLERQPGRLAMTIDSFVVQPWKFPGGDIGRLAVSGTVNDLAVSGAKPVGLALSMILAEGLPMADLDAALDSAAETAREAGVSIVTGDTKVVGHGQADGIYLITAGVGRVPARRNLGPAHVLPGHLLLINGAIGDHGLAVMLAREMPAVKSPVRSDVAPLNGIIDVALSAAGQHGIVFMRDPTRGGLAGLCSDLARQCGHHIVLDETQIIVKPESRHAADMLGLDPLDIANEGKVVFAVTPHAAKRVLAALKSHPLGREATIIGEVTGASDGLCEIRTIIGGRRIVQKPYGEQLPRIC